MRNRREKISKMKNLEIYSWCHCDGSTVQGLHVSGFGERKRLGN